MTNTLYTIPTLTRVPERGKAMRVNNISQECFFPPLRGERGSRSVAWLDGMVEILVSARKALEPTSYPRLQDFLDALQSFEAYLRFQPALIFPLAASRQLRRALTIRYRDSSVDSNIPGTSLDQGVFSHFKILSAEIEIEPT